MGEEGGGRMDIWKFTPVSYRPMRAETAMRADTALMPDRAV